MKYKPFSKQRRHRLLAKRNYSVCSDEGGRQPETTSLLFPRPWL